MPKHWSNAQPDLFEEPPSGAALAPAERAKALEQLQALLIEAMATPTVSGRFAPLFAGLTAVMFRRQRWQGDLSASSSTA